MAYYRDSFLSRSGSVGEIEKAAFGWLENDSLLDR
jgi:hypothetical protein